MIRAGFAALLAVALVATAPSKKHPAPAQAAAASVGQWNLVTDQLHANLASGEFSAPDKVHMTRADGSTVDADRATGNYKLKQAQLYGHVVVHDTSGHFGLQSAQGAQQGPATLTTDELRIDDVSHLYDAAGDVHYEQGDNKADAQSAHLNDATHQLDMKGKVHVVEGDRTMDADSATYNTITGAGEAQGNVTMIFPGGNISIATPKPINIKNPKVP